MVQEENVIRDACFWNDDCRKVKDPLMIGTTIKPDRKYEFVKDFGVFKENDSNCDLCMAFCTYIKYNQDNERYMRRKEGLYAIKQLFRIS